MFGVYTYTNKNSVGYNFCSDVKVTHSIYWFVGVYDIIKIGKKLHLTGPWWGAKYQDV